MLGAVHRARELAEGHEALCVSHQLPIWTLRRFVEGKRLWHDPRRRQCALASLTSLVFDGARAHAAGYSEPAGRQRPDRHRRMTAGGPACCCSPLLRGLLAGCPTSKDAVETGGSFQFVAPGGQTELIYDPPSARGTVGAVAGPSLPTRRRTWRWPTTRARSSCSTSGARGAGRAAPRRRTCSSWPRSRRWPCSGSTCATTPQAARDFTQSAGISYDSISDYPGRSLAGLGGVPRNVVPLTVVLDKQHRVAFVSLVPVQVAKLVPLVQRLATE